MSETTRVRVTIRPAHSRAVRSAAMRQTVLEAQNPRGEFCASMKSLEENRKLAGVLIVGEFRRSKIRRGENSHRRRGCKHGPRLRLTGVANRPNLRPLATHFSAKDHIDAHRQNRGRPAVCRSDARCESREHAAGAQIEAAMAEVTRSGAFVHGPACQKFEAAMAAYCGAKHAIGCASGSDALLLALMALGIGPGDEVIVPSFTFFATASAVWRLGAKPVFADIVPDTFNLDPADVLYKITHGHQGDHSRPPVRPVRRDGRDPADRDGGPRHSDHRRRLPGDRRRVSRRADRLARRDGLLQLLSDEEPGRIRRRRTHHDERRRAGRASCACCAIMAAAAVLSSLRRPQQPARCAAGGRAEREAAAPR